MTVTLGGIALADDLVLTGLEVAAVVAGQRRTLTGTPVLQVAESPGGRTLILDGENHFTLAQLEAVRTLSAAGQPVTLSHHRGTFAVVITAIEAEPAINYANPGPLDWYSGTITLIEV